MTTIDMQIQAESDIPDEIYYNSLFISLLTYGVNRQQKETPQASAMISLTLLFLFTNMLIKLELFIRFH